MLNLTQGPDVQRLLDRASGTLSKEGDPRLKAIVRDLLEGLFAVVERHGVSENEFWGAVDYLGRAAPEFGLIVPGLGIEHFLDLVLDARDAEAGRGGGTPRTIEGPLYVAGAPVSEKLAVLSEGETGTKPLVVRGRVRDLDGTPIGGAMIDVWHADQRGFYSHFDPTGVLAPFAYRRRIRADADGAFEVRTTAPSGYAVPPDGPTQTLMTKLGRHGRRPAHVHFFVDAPNYRHLTTQINLADDPLVNDDFAFGTREGLTPDLQCDASGAQLIEFDFVLTAAEGSVRSNRPRLTA